MSSNTVSPKRCSALTSTGQPCRSWAIHGSDRCSAHTQGKVGAPAGNANRRTHGAYAAPVPTRSGTAAPIASIDDLVADCFHKQSDLAAYIESHLPLMDITDLAKLLALHGQNASRLGRLLRDKRALSGAATDGLLDALGRALDELSTETGIKL